MVEVDVAFMKSFTQVITNSSGVLYNLLQHLQLIKKLDMLLQAQLPAPLNQHCRIATWRDQVLVIHVDSALWAIRLRYQVPDLLRRWQHEIPPVVKVEVKVHPHFATIGWSAAKPTIPFDSLGMSKNGS
jgi:hypothetical protein